MNETNGKAAAQRSDAVEALLGQAAPRPTPPEGVERDIRAAVHAEWAGVARRRRRRRTVTGLAVAASLVLVFAFSLGVLRQAGVAPIQVAVIERSVGTIVVHSAGSGEPASAGSASIMSGQLLTTGPDSAAGLTWLEGGSLRIDSDTRVEFIAEDEVFLHTGRIYFDSAGADPAAGFLVRSPHGVVSHVGTQYLTESTAASLVVSVREGEVRIDGAYHDETVHEGQRVEMTGSARPSVTNTSGVGSEWSWTETVTPAISVDGMTVFDFLHWVGRETGHGVRFETADAEATARRTQLRGSVDGDPRTALRLRMMTVDLDARFDAAAAAIVVSD